MGMGSISLPGVKSGSEFPVEISLSRFAKATLLWPRRRLET